MLITTETKIIRYLSHACHGKTHDYALLKNEFPPERNWFKKFNLRVDLGFIGIAKDYQCGGISIPHKKSKNKPLTDAQKETNRRYAQERICVEHSIAGLKRFRILSDRLRMHDFDLYDRILGICAGLWNFYLAN